MKILPLFLFIGVASGCDVLNNIKEVDINMELLDSGLHRRMSLVANLKGVHRFPRCRILFKLRIPSGAYIDSDSVNSSLAHHHVIASHRFDVEAPEFVSNSHNIFIVSRDEIGDTDLVEDSFILRVKIRYHSASKDVLERRIVFESPSIFLDCGGSGYNCEGIALEPAVGSWIEVSSFEKQTWTSIPVGNKLHASIVLSFTFSVIIFSLAHILTSKPASLNCFKNVY